MKYNHVNNCIKGGLLIQFRGDSQQYYPLNRYLINNVENIVDFPV